MDLSPPVRPLVDRSDPSRPSDRRAFSLWCPTPLQRLYCRVGLSDEAFEWLGRRAFVLTALAWLPLFTLSALAGRAWSGVDVPFLFDIDVQARYLIALPLLVTGELLIHRRAAEVVWQFVEQRIVVGRARAGFDRAIDSATALVRSRLVEMLLLIAVFSIGFAVSGSLERVPGSTWYEHSTDGSTGFTLAGWWYVVVSRPLLQFFLLRWYFRLLVWGRFLWQVSRLPLHLTPTHPDRRAGLGFLSVLSYSFAPFLIAHGTMVSARVANGIVHAGLTLRYYEMEMVVIPAAVLLLVLGPAFVFSSRLWRAKRTGLLEYGALGERYVRDFENKWVRHPRSVSEPLLGSADIQSLADLANSFQNLGQMSVLPPTRHSVLTLLLITLVPLAPLPLTMISGRELFERLVKMVV
jgi:hypothetical protein